MKPFSTKRIARVLRVLVEITFGCNLAVLPAVPALVRRGTLRGVGDLAASMSGFDSYRFVLTLFLIFCGCCTAVILWQGRRVLNTVLRGEPFSEENSLSLKRAAICAFCISGAALLRLIWGFFHYHSIGPIATYNALFVPIFAMAGLLSLIMSALFRQAAEMKSENDLTI
jgi:hypothetical protein